MSQSKKANKKAASKRSKPAQKEYSKSSARSPLRGEASTASAAQGSSPEIEKTPRKANLQTTILRVLAILAVIAITVYTYTLRDRIAEFQALGYPGIFLVALIANATILLPAPGAALVAAVGAIFNPLGVGLAAGTGGAIGELSGYLAGFSGQAVIERTDVYAKIKPWVDKYGGWAILVLSAIPNPLFDVAGIAAGIAKMPFWTFFVFVWIGQIIKMTIFAYAGRYSIDLLSIFIK